MKLTLEQAKQGTSKWVLFGIALLCVGLVLAQFPVTWIASLAGNQTACRLVLQEPSGTLWQGSSAIGFSEPNTVGAGCKTPVAQTERFDWKLSCQIMDASCTATIAFSALEQPQVIRWGIGRPVEWIANEVTLPATVLEGLGNPWSTLRPRGNLNARWTDLTWALSPKEVSGKAGESSGIIRITITNLTSPISPVKPLGSYEVSGNMAQHSINWVLSTTSGPLLLTGQGEMAHGSGSKGLQFSGTASAAPEAEDALMGLLSLLGKKEGNTYRLKL
jgi:general secretion pathway protein N